MAVADLTVESDYGGGEGILNGGGSDGGGGGGIFNGGI